MPFTVITGASMGIGRALAGECAGRGRDLLLLSLPGEGLADVARKLSDEHGIRTLHYEADLTEEGAVDAFYAWCSERDLRIDMLINNAGLGSQGAFRNSAPARFRPLLRLNIETVVSMSWGALPFLTRESRSYILNLGSIGAFTPAPYKSVYTASKHFVRLFSLTLSYELKDTPVSVACLCPGPVRTNDLHRAKIRELGLTGRLLSMEASEVAAYGIDQLMRGKRIIIPGFFNKLLCRVSEWLPMRVRLKLASSTFTDSDYNHAGKIPGREALP